MSKKKESRTTIRGGELYVVVKEERIEGITNATIKATRATLRKLAKLHGNDALVEIDPDNLQSRTKVRVLIRDKRSKP